MKLDSYKELHAVVYGETAIKTIHFGPLKQSNCCFGPHWHNRIEFIRVLSGSLRILIKDEYKTVNKGELAIICPCQLHEGIAVEDNTGYNVVMFDIEDFYNSTVASKNFLKPLAESSVTFNPITSDRNILSAIDAIFEYITADKKVNTLLIHSRVLELLGLLYEKCSPEKRINNPSDEKFNAVIDYINEHYSEKITTSALSAMFGYDEAYFCRRFKRVTGITAMKYINILRLEKAQHLLKRSNDEIAIIAVNCGFTDTSYFAQSFHSHYGMSPTDFRKKSTLHSKEAK